MGRNASKAGDEGKQELREEVRAVGLEIVTRSKKRRNETGERIKY